MPQQSPNIGLTLYDRTADKPELFIDYRDAIAGTGATSDMSIIDDTFGQVLNTLEAMQGTGWTDESILANANAIASLKSKGVYTAATVGTNTLTATVADFVGEPPANASVIIVPSASNTTTVTLSINSETAKPVVKVRNVSGSSVFTPLDAKDLRHNMPILVRKTADNVRYVLVNFGEDFARNVFYDNGDTSFSHLQDVLTPTLNDAIANPTTNTGTLNTILSWFANRIKAITGKSDWKTAPRTTLENAVKLNGDVMTGSLTSRGIRLATNAGGITNQKASLGTAVPSISELKEVIVDLGAVTTIYGTIKITVASVWVNNNTAGSLVKEVDIQASSASINTIHSTYTYTGKNLETSFMIGDPYVEGGRLKFKVIQQVNSKNSIIVTVETYGQFHDITTMSISEWAISAETFERPSGININSRGSNANGEWIRFEDGTQICWHYLDTAVGNSANGALWVSPVLTWTFPAAFSVVPEFIASIKSILTSGTNPVSVSRPTSSGVSGTTASTIAVWYAGSSATVSTRISVMAIGRWK